MRWTIVDEISEMNCGLNKMRWNMNNEDDNVTCRERLPHLKVVSNTFLLVCFLSLNGSTCQTRKNVFILPQKLFVLEKIKF